VKDSTTTNQVNVEPLQWEALIKPPTGVWAANTADVETRDHLTAEFVIVPDGRRWDVSGTDSPLMPDASPGDFATLEAAQTWCEGRNLLLVKGGAA
jgi:hypothetical protein